MFEQMELRLSLFHRWHFRWHFPCDGNGKKKRKMKKTLSRNELEVSTKLIRCLMLNDMPFDVDTDTECVHT